MKPVIAARKPYRPAGSAAGHGAGNGVPDVLLPFGAMGQAYLSALGACQDEARSFLTKRLSADVAYGQNLAKCGNLGEAAAVHQEWARRTVMDYVNEGQVLLGIFNRAFAGGADTDGKTA